MTGEFTKRLLALVESHNIVSPLSLSLVMILLLPVITDLINTVSYIGGLWGNCQQNEQHRCMIWSLLSGLGGFMPQTHLNSQVIYDKTVSLKP